MTEQIQIDLAHAILETGLVGKVYHNCQMLRNHENFKMYPVYKRGEEYLYAGIDDTSGLFAYVRTNGEMVSRVYPMSSCEKAWDVFAPLRVVFYNDREDRNHGWLLKQLTAFTFQHKLTLQRVIDDKWRLLKEESDLTRGSFDGNTFYVAFDVLVNFVLSHDTCVLDPCTTASNPLCL